MALRRFYVDQHALQGEQLTLQGELFHHIRDVCRFKAGDRFEVLPGDGQAILVEISELEKRTGQARVLSRRTLTPLAKPYITLALSIPKLPKVDWIIEKCVELGVYEIRPFVSEFSFLRRLSEVTPARLQRWQKIVQAATQQSGRGELMRIGNPTTLEKLLEEFKLAPRTGGLFPYEGEAQIPLSSAIEDLKHKNLESAWVFVGSEGGFSASEVELFSREGLPPVSMGEQILRVETACVAIASILQYELNPLRRIAGHISKGPTA